MLLFLFALGYISDVLAGTFILRQRQQALGKS